MNILVCGGTRFYGKELIQQLLDHHHKVTIVSRRKLLNQRDLTYIRGELSPELVESLQLGNEFDFVISNICMDEKDVEVHIKCFQKICKKHIFISSIGVYKNNTVYDTGNEHDYNPFDLTLYEEQCHLDKRKMERKIVRTLPIGSYYILRPSIIIGVDDWTKRLDFYIQRLLDENGIISLGDGNCKFNWVCDWQLANIVVYLIENSHKFNDAIYNASSNKAISFIEFIKRIADILKLSKIKFLSVQEIPSKELPYSGFRDPYGKENATCNITRLRTINPLLTDVKEQHLNDIIRKTINRINLNQVPDYHKRNLELEFIERYSDFIKILEI